MQFARTPNVVTIDVPVNRNFWIAMNRFKNSLTQLAIQLARHKHFRIYFWIDYVHRSNRSWIFAIAPKRWQWFITDVSGLEIIFLNWRKHKPTYGLNT